MKVFALILSLAIVACSARYIGFESRYPGSQLDFQQHGQEERSLLIRTQHGHQIQMTQVNTQHGRQLEVLVQGPLFQTKKIEIVEQQPLAYQQRVPYGLSQVDIVLRVLAEHQGTVNEVVFQRLVDFLVVSPLQEEVQGHVEGITQADKIVRIITNKKALNQIVYQKLQVTLEKLFQMGVEFRGMEELLQVIKHKVQLDETNYAKILAITEKAVVESEHLYEFGRTDAISKAEFLKQVIYEQRVLDQTYNDKLYAIIEKVLLEKELTHRVFENTVVKATPVEVLLRIINDKIVIDEVTAQKLLGVVDKAIITREITGLDVNKIHKVAEVERLVGIVGEKRIADETYHYKLYTLIKKAMRLTRNTPELEQLLMIVEQKRVIDQSNYEQLITIAQHSAYEYEGLHGSDSFLPVTKADRFYRMIHVIRAMDQIVNEKFLVVIQKAILNGELNYQIIDETVGAPLVLVLEKVILDKRVNDEVVAQRLRNTLYNAILKEEIRSTTRINILGAMLDSYQGLFHVTFEEMLATFESAVVKGEASKTDFELLRKLSEVTTEQKVVPGVVPTMIEKRLPVEALTEVVIRKNVPSTQWRNMMEMPVYGGLYREQQPFQYKYAQKWY